MFNTSKKIKTHEIIIVTIDSASVGVAICNETVEMEISNRRVLWSIRESIPLPQSVTMELYLQSTDKILKKVLTSLVESKMKIPTDVHVVLSSPWQFSQTRFVSQSKEKPFKITKKLMHDLMKKEETSFLSDVKQNADHLGDNLELFEAKTMNMTLNGYVVDEPTNKITKNINVVMHMATASRVALSNFTDTIKSQLPKTQINFHTSIFAYFAVLRDMFFETKSFLFIEIGEILSEAVIVHEGALSQSVSFPVGLQNQTLEISKTLGRTEKEIATYLRMYKDGTLEDNLVTGVEKGLSNATSHWAEVFGEALTSISKGIIVPDAIFLVSSGKNIQWIEKALHKEIVQGFTIASQAFNAVTIAPEHFNQYIRTASGVEYDVPLELFALYISTKEK